MISFSSIKSCRLGKSLGINNIPTKKICSYSCIYCQIGITDEYRSTRAIFYDPSVIYEKVKKHLSILKEKDRPDYLTFVANGKPTLDINLGQSIKKLKAFNIPIAVITNASLLKSSSVREDLQLADWVSVKIDTADEKIWKKINRSYTKIYFDDYLSGLIQFSQEYKDKLATETMLVNGVMMLVRLYSKQQILFAG
jgi:wyosine [tRNA(Phe)-imidazoG37] synthetase (radical SAM superfamily)